MWSTLTMMRIYAPASISASRISLASVRETPLLGDVELDGVYVADTAQETASGDEGTGLLVALVA